MEENKDKVIYVPVEDILPNRFQPRLAFDEKELNELANSIIKYGVIQPIVLRTIGEKYEIIAGERRYKASVLAGLKKIPSIIMQTDDNTSAEIALLENIQRKNLTVVEEAQSYKKLIDKGFTQEDIALKLGVSQSSVANKIRLLNLPKEVQNALLYNQISERHARSLLVLNNEDLQNNLLKRIINEKLTVKQTEDEINVLMHKDSIENDALPEDIQKFLKPEQAVISKEEQIGANNVEEIIDIKVPDVVTIVETADNKPTIYEEESEIINPFQTEGNSTNIAKNIILKSTQEEIPQSTNETVEPVTKSIEEQTNENTSSTNQNIASSPINYIRKIDDISEEESEEFYDEDSLLTDDGQVDLPKVINKIRDFINNLDEVSSLINVDEVDLVNNYQITITIDKNLPM